jgi:hypothetical protein
MFICDAAAATSREVTPEGFLRVRARIGRTGLHTYRAVELGNPVGFSPEARVRVWRPPAEVFDAQSRASFAGKPVTDNHPPMMVDARNWKRYAIGHCGASVEQDGDHLVTDLIIADAGAAGRAQQGAELSNGYHADFVFEPGTTPDGEAYDAVQRNIRGNHVALVDAGRCGDTCRIGDAVADAACGCGTTPEAPVPEAPPEPPPIRLPPAAPDAALLDALVQDHLQAVEGARRIVGPSVDTRGRGTAEIRRLVVRRKLGPARTDNRDDAYVAAAFDALLATHAPANPLASHLAGGAGLAAFDRAASLAARNHALTHAWKGEALQGDR